MAEFAERREMWTLAELTYLTEHGITGDVLCALDNESLVDLGMTSLGHRLSVLRAVYELKKEQGIEMGEDDWRPQGGLLLSAIAALCLCPAPVPSLLTEPQRKLPWKRWPPLRR